MHSWTARTFGSLQVRNFRILWLGTLSAFVSFFMSTVAQAIVAFDLTGTNGSVGLVVGGQGLGQLLFGPVGGVAADRFPRRFLVIASQAGITATFAVIAVLLALGLLTVWLLALGSFVVGAAFAFLGPARTSMMMDFVGPDRRGNAVALSQVALNASRVVGPPIVGLLIWLNYVGKPGAYFFMAGLYALALLLTVVLPPALRIASTGRTVLGDMSSGLMYVSRLPRLRLLVVSYGVVIMVGFPYVAVLPGLLENELGRDSGGMALTVIYTATAAGGLVASLWVASFADGGRADFVYGAGAVLFGVSLIATGLAPNYVTATAAMFVVGVGSGAFQTLNGALVAQTSSPEYFGRVLSLTFLAFAGFGIVAIPVGIAADAFGERPVLVTQGVLVSAAMALFLLVAARLPRAEPVAVHLRGPQPGGGK